MMSKALREKYQRSYKTIQETPAAVRCVRSVRSLFFFIGACGLLRADVLYDAFRDPPMQARPFVRWWWNGGRVEINELTRELDVMKAAGIGGVEINTIAMPEAATAASLAAHPAVAWLSPEWIELVRQTTSAARARGMTSDLIVGSGWPFGGRFLGTHEQTQRVRLVKYPLAGKSRVSFSRSDLLKMTTAPAASAEQDPEPAPTASELVFVRVAPVSRTGAFTPGREMSSEFDPEGRITFDVPAGDHELYIGIRDTGFTHVKLGAPGADGPVVNHFNAAAVRKYLDHMTENLSPALDGNLGNAIRAMFIDSLELDHANWTDDLSAHFQSRRGYDLLPYLPFVLQPNDATESEFNRTIRRVRYDFDLTLLQLFEERFLTTYRDWAAANKVKARIQAYGRETHPLEGSMRADLPEGETWLWVDKFRPERIRVDATVVNKYVSSAANLTGQRLRSFEAMTNAVPVFRETLQDFKRATDASILSGLNHPIIHGYNYTPLDAGFPGWVRFGCYVNERTPWWPYFRSYTDYAARLGTIMRHTEARARIAILAPRAEEWAKHGLLYQPFPEVVDPWYQFKLVDAIQQAGYNVDYISESVLANGENVAGQLRYGPCAYDLIITEDVGALEPKTADALADLVATGGHVAFIGQQPNRSPGLDQAADKDDRVQAAVSKINQRAAGAVWHLPPPVQDTGSTEGQNEKVLLEFAMNLLAKTGMVPDVKFASPRPSVSQISQVAGNRAVYFLVNSDAQSSVDVVASFPASKGRPYLWDPQTGEKEVIPADEHGQVRLTLVPTGSALIVFNPDEIAVTATMPDVRPPRETVVQQLNGPWDVRLVPAGTSREIKRRLQLLSDLSKHDEDLELKSFGGAATYSLDFDGSGSDEVMLDLGQVENTSEVILNGHNLGSRWWGLHRYTLKGALLPGKNHLEIKITTVLANLMKHKKDDAAAQRWASWAPPIPTGLIGPVRLIQGASRSDAVASRTK